MPPNSDIATYSNIFRTVALVSGQHQTPTLKTTSVPPAAGMKILFFRFRFDPGSIILSIVISVSGQDTPLGHVPVSERSSHNYVALLGPTN